MTKEKMRGRIEKMRQLRNDGLTYAAIGEQYGLSKQRIYQLLGGDGRCNSKGALIDKKWLRVQVEIKGRWSTDIAKELGMSKSMINERVNCCGFERTVVLGPGEWPTEPAFKGIGGYLYVYSPFHPHTNCIGRMTQHRLVAEKYLGYYLRPGRRGEILHHIDGDRANNEARNLCMFENMGYHTAFHCWLRGKCKVPDESHITWIIPESRERMIKFCGWPENG